jgi:four helix bundle protein
MKDFRNLKVWEKAHFLTLWVDEPDASMQRIASGSASELDYHFLLARDLGFFEEMDYRRLAGELLHLRKMLTALR